MHIKICNSWVNSQESSHLNFSGLISFFNAGAFQFQIQQFRLYFIISTYLPDA